MKRVEKLMSYDPIVGSYDFKELLRLAKACEEFEKTVWPFLGKKNK